METIRVDLQKLQILNDRIAQCIDALNQLGLSCHAPQLSFGGFYGTYGQPFTAPWQQGYSYTPQFGGWQQGWGYSPQIFGYGLPMTGTWGLPNFGGWQQGYTYPQNNAWSSVPSYGSYPQTNLWGGNFGTPAFSGYQTTGFGYGTNPMVRSFPVHSGSSVGQPVG